LLDNTVDETLGIEVRARGIVGEPRSTISTSASSETSSQRIISSIFAIVLVAIQFSLLLFIVRRKRFQKYLKYIFPFLVPEEVKDEVKGADFNNLGFRLLHIGQIEDAKKYLQRAIEIKPDPYPLGNLAHLYAIEGKYTEAISLCEIAKEYAFDINIQAFLEYCLFCIYLYADKKIEALPHLKEALTKDKETIIGYYNRNINIARWKEDKDILSVFLAVK
jgi:tetratricopeptide (TPR) repeat protein